MRIPDTGGTPEEIVSLSGASNSTGLSNSQYVPSGRAVIFVTGDPVSVAAKVSQNLLGPPKARLAYTAQSCRCKLRNGLANFLGSANEAAAALERENRQLWRVVKLVAKHEKTLPELEAEKLFRRAARAHSPLLTLNRK
jgi:hypothetical protein